jgi:hypothetical protein
VLVLKLGFSFKNSEENLFPYTFQLINSAGCSLNLNMMSDFHVLGNSPSHLPSSSLPPPSSSSSTMNNFPHRDRVAIASAQFPSMFRFNTAITTTPELIRFECTVKPCEAIEAKQAPCGQKVCGENKSNP